VTWTRTAGTLLGVGLFAATLAGCTSGSADHTPSKPIPLPSGPGAKLTQCTNFFGGTHAVSKEFGEKSLILDAVTSRRGTLQCSYVSSDKTAASTGHISLTLTTDLLEGSVSYPCCAQAAVSRHVLALVVGSPRDDRQIASSSAWLTSAAKRAEAPT